MGRRRPGGGDALERHVFRHSGPQLPSHQPPRLPTPAGSTLTRGGNRGGSRSAGRIRSRPAPSPHQGATPRVRRSGGPSGAPRRPEGAPHCGHASVSMKFRRRRAAWPPLTPSRTVRRRAFRSRGDPHAQQPLRLPATCPPRRCRHELRELLTSKTQWLHASRTSAEPTPARSAPPPGEDPRRRPATTQGRPRSGLRRHQVRPRALRRAC